MQSVFCVTNLIRQEAGSLTGAGNHREGLSVIQTSGIAMSGVRHVNKIPTIRGTDIIRDPRVNKVMRAVKKVGVLSGACMFGNTSSMDRWKSLLHSDFNEVVLLRKPCLYFKLLEFIFCVYYLWWGKLQPLISVQCVVCWLNFEMQINHRSRVYATQATGDGHSLDSKY